MSKHDFDPNSPSPIRQMLIKQLELAQGFMLIERDNGLYYPPIDMFGNSQGFLSETQTVAFQEWCRSTMWRVIEELAEADVEEPKSNEFYVEVCDAMHFMLELSIMTGISAASIEDCWPKTAEMWHAHPLLGIVARDLGLAGHNLKTRPWKRTQKVTNIKDFQHCVLRAWNSLFVFWVNEGFTQEKLLELYMAKHRENVGRQQSVI